MTVDTDSESPLAPKACDECGRRKIRCDRVKPCCACSAAGRVCTFSPKLHLRNPRQRILVTRKYEDKVDHINIRAKAIEASLRKLVSEANTPQSSKAPTSTHSEPDSHADREGSQADDHHFNVKVDSPGLSSDHTLQKQCLYVKNFLDSIVISQFEGAAPGPSSSINAAVMALKDIVSCQKRGSVDTWEEALPSEKPLSPGALAQLPMPPLEAIMRLFNHSMDGPPTLFSSNCALVGLTVSDLLSLCISVYTAPDTASHSAMTIVNSGLYYLFAEQAMYEVTSHDTDDFVSYRQMCERNLNICIRSTPLFTSDTTRQVQALLLGVTYAIDVCSPAVAWHLNSAAAQLCQSGGFHRAKGTSDDMSDEARIKRTLFWTAYTYDKCLSLRLGYASTVRETDITVPREYGVAQLEEGCLPRLWLMTSSLRATAYERLYSPEAQSFSSTEMGYVARGLGSECRAMEIEVLRVRNETMTSIPSLDQMGVVKLYVASATVQFYTLITLVYRMIPPPEGSLHKFTPECIDAARNAIRHHLNAVQQLGGDELYQAVYVNWTLMLTPFAPFFVLFCHLITVLDPVDMDLLRSFVASLEDLKSATTTAGKLHQLCKAMLDVACICYDAAYSFTTLSDQGQAEIQAGLGDDFNMFLSQLDFEDEQGNLPMPDFEGWFTGGFSSM